MKNITKIILVFAICLLNFNCYAQNKVLLTNGTSLNSNSIVVEKESVKLDIDGEPQSFGKNEILCIVPEGKTGYTFSARNNKKMKIKKKDIYYDYEGTDIARLFGYKYFKTPFDIAQLYRLNMNNTLSEEEFKNIFNAQQKTLKSRSTISLVAAGAALLIGLSSLLITMKDVNSLSYNNLNMLAPDNLKIDYNTSFIHNFGFHERKCA